MKTYRLLSDGRNEKINEAVKSMEVFFENYVCAASFNEDGKHLLADAISAHDIDAALEIEDIEGMRGLGGEAYELMLGFMKFVATKLGIKEIEMDSNYDQPIFTINEDDNNTLCNLHMDLKLNRILLSDSDNAYTYEDVKFGMELEEQGNYKLEGPYTADHQFIYGFVGNLVKSIFEDAEDEGVLISTSSICAIIDERINKQFR